MAGRYIVGIDLGTTHTVVAYADTRGESVVRPFSVEQLVARGEVAPRPLLPSLRYHAHPDELGDADVAELGGSEGGDERDASAADDPRATVVIGELARELGSRVPGRLVSSAKSWLCHAGVDRTAAILPWGAPEDVPKVSPVDASASYLRHVRSAWDRAFPAEPLADQEVVLTVPASFDEAARALTLRAARLAKLPKVRLVEEPQAAFYHFLDRHAVDLAGALGAAKLALVVDVGGGTTDLTLIRIETRENGPRLTRIAVGEHLMLGGDNMDLALAKRVESRVVGEGSQLGVARFSQLIQQCRAAKERLLSPDAPTAVPITVLGSGSKIVGGARTADVTLEEASALVLDGFFPVVGLDATPEKRRTAIVEFGLPYVADPAVTRHVAAFLNAHADLAREALGTTHGPPAPDAVLFNGGVFRSPVLAQRVVDVLGGFRGAPVTRLRNDEPDLAVARGAVAYGLARRGIGVRIGGGSPRTYFLVLSGEDERPRRGVCLLPRGAEEGEEIVLESQRFSLRLGRPVRFHLTASAADVRHVRPGDLATLEGDDHRDLPPLAAILEDSSGREGEVPVRVVSALTEVGTLEIGCVSADDELRRWKLELQLRGDAGGERTGERSGVAHRVAQLHPRFAEATQRVQLVYGKSARTPTPRDVKTLRADLEKILGPREGWNTPLLRELFAALLAGAKHRRRSADHERVWFNLVGYALRPGFGYPLDDWRCKQVAGLLDQGLQFAPEAQNWAEWWICFRRIAGGLDARSQERLVNEVEWYIEPPSPRPKKRPAGPRKLAYDDMVRLVGSLERIGRDRKARLGDQLLERLRGSEESRQSYWAVGRLGARVPFYGSAHEVVPRHVAERWLDACLEVDLRKVPDAAFAVAMLARKSGDRERDLSDAHRERALGALQRSGASSTWSTLVREVTHLEASDEKRVFGESLPPGLRLLE